MRTRVLWLTLVVAVLVAIGATPAFANLSGAVFTTTVDGSRVTTNIFSARTGVYLSGGSGWNAPANAPGLPEGWYVFQVTDPTGKTLLSQDPVGCRRFHVNSFGVIDDVKGADWTQGSTTEYFEHQTGTDADHGGDPWNAIAVQLAPFANTPNPSGVYRVWAMLESDFLSANGGEGALALIDPPGQDHGFARAKSKIDSFKIGGTAEQRLTVQKFCDANANGTWDAGEKEISAWPIKVGEPSAIAYDPLYTRVGMITQVSGTWSVTEADKPLGDSRDWKQTALVIDGTPKTPSRSANIRFAASGGERHTVVFGNVPLGTIVAHEFQDRNCNRVQDSGEDDVAGFKFAITGTSGAASGYKKTITTNSNGLAQFEKLLPGTYMLVRQPKEGWLPTTDSGKEIALETCDTGSNDPVVRTAHFGDVKSLKIRAAKFVDSDGDGTWDGGEDPVAGWAFMLTGTDKMGHEVSSPKLSNANGEVVWTDTGVIEGDYIIPGLYPGDYVVREVLRSDTELVLASGLSYRIDGAKRVRKPPARSLDVEAGAGQEWSIEFGNCAPATVEAIQLQDDDADGVGDRPKAGWTMTLTGTTGQGDPVSMTGTTDSDGKVVWGGLWPGTYTVQSAQADGWRTMGPGAYKNVKLASAGMESRTFVTCQETSYAVDTVQRPRCERTLRDLRAHGRRHHYPIVGRSGRQHCEPEGRDRFRRSSGLRPPAARHVLRRADRFRRPQAGSPGRCSVSAGDGVGPRFGHDRGAARGDSHVPVWRAQAAFFDVFPSRVLVNKFYDANMNGIRDPGEAGVKGIEIVLIGTEAIDGRRRRQHGSQPDRIQRCERQRRVRTGVLAR